VPVKIIQEFMFHEAPNAGSTKAFGACDDWQANRLFIAPIGHLGYAQALALRLLPARSGRSTPELSRAAKRRRLE
jgi:hypothetical protein